MSRELTVGLDRGGILQAFVAGDPTGDLLVYHHGTPAAGPISEDLSTAAAASGFAIVELVRPGYGRSTRQPGRDVASVVPLVEALADELGAQRFATVGWSGGGPHAAATAALLPDRCAGAMLLASVGPYDAPDLDFLAGMGQDNIDEFGAALAGPAELEEFLGTACKGLRDVSADDVIASMESLLPAVDRAFLTGDAAEEFAEELRFSTREPWGWYDDDIAFTLPWGFDLSGIAVPVSVWQGSDDLMVPAAHGDWLVRAIPTSRPHLLAGHGHLSLSEHLGAGFAELRRDLEAAR